MKQGLTFRTTGVLSAAALMTLAAAACSSSSKSSSTSPGTSAPPTSSSSSAPPSSSSSSSPSSSAPSSGGTTVGVGSASVKGTQTTVLVAPDGHTLYFFDPDTAGGQPTCTGGCAGTWPPLVAASPTEASAATGKLATVSGANGNQVTYNGHPLYEFHSDTAAGQANGDGILGKWHVATPGLAAGGASSPTSPSSGGSGGYGSGGGGGY